MLRHDTRSDGNLVSACLCSLMIIDQALILVTENIKPKVDVVYDMTSRTQFFANQHWWWFVFLPHMRERNVQV